MTAYTDLTEAQKGRLLIWNKALDTLMPWFAKEVPAIGNQTVSGLADDIGRVNQLKKDVDKIEKTLKERFKALRGNNNSVRGDIYELKVSTQERTALDQEAAKGTLGLLNRYDVPKLVQWLQTQAEVPLDVLLDPNAPSTLQQHMKTTEVETIRVGEI